jgi:enoyl-CoA hydratase/carnithine racemase
MTSPLHVAARPDGVAIVTIDVPGAAANVLRADFTAQLAGVIDRLEGDPAIQAAVLVSAKETSFLAGADVAALAALRTRADERAFCRRGQAAIDRVRASRKPIVAAIHGPAVAAGFEVALACHERIASDDPRTAVGLPQVHVGLVPALHGLPHLALLVGFRRALDVALRGDLLPPGQAMALGLVDRVTPRGALVEAAARRALSRTRLQVGQTVASRGARSLVDRTLDASPLALRVLFARARRQIRARTRGDDPASERFVDVLEALARGGWSAAAQAEEVAFGDLLVTSTSRRLVELFLAERALEQAPSDAACPERGPGAFERRLRAVQEREAQALLADGATREQIEEALIDWGFALAPPGGGAPGARAAPKRGRRAPAPRPRIAREEIQLRCALQIVNEALRALGDGAIRSPREGDVRAVREVGFPRFRGGPFRYLEDVGPDEVLRRMRPYEARYGERWAPAPQLVELAASARGRDAP